MTQTRGRVSGPAAVDRYLLPQERRLRIITVRRHPAVLIVPIAEAVGGLVAAFLLSATLLRTDAPIRDVVWLIWIGLALNLVWKALNWAVDYFVVTSRRIMLTSGLFTRKVAMMPLGKVTDMSFQRSFAGRVLGYGDFIIESAGQDQALRTVDHIPYPEQLYLEVCEMLWPPTPAADCKMCNGSGNVVMAEERRLVTVTCPNCDGTGKAPEPSSRYEDTVVEGTDPNTDPNED
ncbi:MAG TPA: PH domain-containing protein [Streptosporangiaceae bacterium]|nr:PH domain-containing protein [Streptosporangiaceae bacterium]